MAKAQTTVRFDGGLLREAERLARERHKTLDELIEEALRRELQPLTDSEPPPPPQGTRLPTHGHGGLRPGVELDDKELMDRLLSEP